MYISPKTYIPIEKNNIKFNVNLLELYKLSQNREYQVTERFIPEYEVLGTYYINTQHPNYVNQTGVILKVDGIEQDIILMEDK